MPIRDSLLRTLASANVLAMPEHLPDSAWLGHVPFAFWLVAAHRPARTVELGVHNGASLCALVQGSKAVGHHAAFWGVDHWLGDDHAGYHAEDVYWSLMAFHEERHRDLSTLMRCGFDEAAGHFEAGALDLVHVDGFHSYEAVRHDFETWLPKMGPRGVMIFHDTAERREGFGVWRFWDEVSARYPSFAFSHSHGLGVLYVGTDPVPEWMAALAEAQATPEGDAIRTYFNALGDGVARLRHTARVAAELARHGGEAEAQRQRADRLQGEVAMLRRCLDAAHSVSASHSARIGSLIGRIHETDHALIESRALAGDLQARIAEADRQREEATVLAAELQARVGSLTAKAERRPGIVAIPGVASIAGLLGLGAAEGDQHA